MDDSSSDRPAVHVSIDQRGQQVDSQTNAARDVRQGGEPAESRDGRRRTPRVYDEELVSALHDLRQQIGALNTAINELRTNNANLHTEVALLKFQVGHLNDRLRSTAQPWGPAQWVLVAIMIAVSIIAAAYVSAAQ